MTPEQQRIAIAEACGWLELRTKEGDVRGYPPGFDANSECDEVDYDVPDYLSDLNAMHEAERHRWLADMKKLHTDVKVYDEWKLYQCLLDYNLHATAERRAEAFLRAIGKWVENS